MMTSLGSSESLLSMYEITSDPMHIDLQAAHAFLSKTYWSQEMTRLDGSKEKFSIEMNRV
jgi:hypothetical protein